MGNILSKSSCVALVSIVLCYSHAFGKKTNPTSNEPKNHKIQDPIFSLERKPAQADLKTLSLSIEDRHWKVWDGVTAVPEHRFQNRRQKTIMGRVSGYVLVKSSESSSLENFKHENPIVVFNENLGQPGLVTGTLTIKMKYRDEIKDLIREYNLKILDSFNEISLFYLTHENSPFNLSELFQQLQKDDRVEKVEAEILNRPHEKE